MFKDHAHALWRASHFDKKKKIDFRTHKWSGDLNKRKLQKYLAKFKGEKNLYGCTISIWFCEHLFSELYLKGLDSMFTQFRLNLLAYMISSSPTFQSSLSQFLFPKWIWKKWSLRNKDQQKYLRNMHTKISVCSYNSSRSERFKKFWDTHWKCSWALIISTKLLSINYDQQRYKVTIATKEFICSTHAKVNSRL